MAVRGVPAQSMRIASGVLFSIAILALPAHATAAVVRTVHAFASAAATRIIVDVDGDFRYHTRASADGRSVLVDIEGATLGEDVPRILPVSDRRVDGVVVLHDSAARIVRVSVDIAGRVAPRLDAVVDGSRLILNFVDASAPQPDVASQRRAAGSTTATQPMPEPQARVARSQFDRERTPGGSTRTAGQRSAAIGAARVVAASKRASSSPHEGDRLQARAALPSRSIMERPVVILDPGHGGKDPGARAWTGEFEKDIVLDLAERVARRLRSHGDVEVVMTRSGDEYVALADRRDASRRWNADVFVSIHANASRSAAARGFETYYHSRSSAGSVAAMPADRVIRRLVRVENGGRANRDRGAAAGGVSPASLSPVSTPVLDRRAESIRLAKLVQAELVRQLGMRYEAVRDLGAKEGPFFVIGNNAAPSVLVEAAFLTHREEGLRMRSEVYREQIAEGVAGGICLFLEEQGRRGAL